MDVDILDVDMLDKIQRTRRFYNDTDGTSLEEERFDHLPEDLLEDTAQYMGDGRARLTVSGSLSSNHEFHKAEAFVSIAVACNNDAETIDIVHGILKQRVEELVVEDLEEMCRLRDPFLPPDKRLFPDAPVEAPGKVATPPRRTSKAMPAKGAKAPPRFGR